MSTPQTLAQTVAPHHYNLDYRRRPLLNVNDRQLPPPRPSSNVSTGYYHPTTTVPPRPSSGLSNRQYTQSQQPIQRADTSQSGSSISYSHQIPPQAKESVGYSHPHHHQHTASNTSQHSDSYHPQQHHHGQLHHAAYDDVRRTTSRASQHQRHAPMPSAAAAHTPSAPEHSSAHPSTSQQAGLHTTVSSTSSAGNSRQSKAGAERDKRRKNKSPVDWVAFFNGKVPDEIITIHDDDSPAPVSLEERSDLPAQIPPQYLQSVTANGTASAHHIDKRRRTNADVYEDSRTSHAHSTANTTSTDSLNNTTAPTSLASVGSATSRLEGPQVGQKRKRSYVKPDSDHRSSHESQASRPRGYLAPYGNYVRSLVHYRKQKDVHVRHVSERNKPADKVDDDDGHYIVHEGSNIGERYKLQALLGQGTFGKVVRAQDLRTRKEVAVKIIRAVPKYRDASRIELRVLQTLRVADEGNRNRCIQLYDCFDWRGHICIVTPLLGLSVFDFLKTGGFVPFPGSQIQAFAWQLLGSIAFLHDTNLIHTDLKPENILLLNHAYQTFTYNRNIPSSSTLTARNAKFRRVLLNPSINLIDFGSATFDDEYHSSVVSTRHYRAPEIILGIGWSFPIDLWSLGCILVECWTGDALFQTHDCAEHLAMMEMVTGYPIDRSMIREVSRTQKRSDRNSAAKFFKNGHLAYPMADTPRQSRRFVKAMKRLDEIVPPTNAFNKLFLDLLRKIFVYDPKKRITAKEALKHPWFDEIVEDDGTEATKISDERERQERERGNAEVKRR